MLCTVIVYRFILQRYVFNYDYVKINFNMPIKMQTFSGSHNFIKIKQIILIKINVYFQLQEPLSYK